MESPKDTSSVQSLYDFFEVSGEPRTFKTEVKEKIALVSYIGPKLDGADSDAEDSPEETYEVSKTEDNQPVLRESKESSDGKQDESFEKGDACDVDPLGDSNYDSSSSSSSEDSSSESSTDSESSEDESESTTGSSDEDSYASECEYVYQQFPQKADMDTIIEVEVHEGDGTARSNESEQNKDDKEIYTDEDFDGDSESLPSSELQGVVAQYDDGILVEQDYACEVLEKKVGEDLAREKSSTNRSPVKDKSQTNRLSRPMEHTTCKRRCASDSYSSGLKKREPIQKGYTFKRPNQLSARTVEKITKYNSKVSKSGNKGLASQSQSVPGLPSRTSKEELDFRNRAGFEVAAGSRSLSGVPPESMNKSRANGEDSLSRCSAKGDEAAPRNASKSSATTPTIRERRTVERIVEEIMPESRCGSVARRDAIFSRNREEVNSAELAEATQEKDKKCHAKVHDTRQLKGKEKTTLIWNSRVKPGPKRQQPSLKDRRKAGVPPKSAANKYTNSNSTYSTTSFGNSYKEDFESCSAESNGKTCVSEQTSTKSGRSVIDNGLKKSPYLMSQKPRVTGQVLQKIVLPSIDSKRPVQLTSAELTKRAARLQKEKSNYIQRNKALVIRRELIKKKTSRESSSSDIECDHHNSKKSGIAVPLKSEACFRDGQLEVSVFGNQKEYPDEGPVDVKITLVHRYMAPVRGPRPYADYGKKRKDRSIDAVFFGSTDRDIIKHRAVHPGFNTHTNPEASARHIQYFGI